MAPAQLNMAYLILELLSGELHVWLPAPLQLIMRKDRSVKFSSRILQISDEWNLQEELLSSSFQKELRVYPPLKNFSTNLIGEMSRSEAEAHI